MSMLSDTPFKWHIRISKFQHCVPLVAMVLGLLAQNCFPLVFLLQRAREEAVTGSVQNIFFSDQDGSGKVYPLTMFDPKKLIIPAPSKGCQLNNKGW